MFSDRRAKLQLTQPSHRRLSRPDEQDFTRVCSTDYRFQRRVVQYICLFNSKTIVMLCEWRPGLRLVI
jgi:hypothetical protein